MKNKKTPDMFIIPNIFIRVIEAETLSDALKSAPFHIAKNVTGSWSKAGRPNDNRGISDFCIDYMKKNTKFENDFGFVVVMSNNRNERRKKIYKSSTIVKTGTCRLKKSDTKKYYVFRGDDGKIVSKVLGTAKLTVVKRIGKDLMSSLEYKGDKLTCNIEYLIENSKPVFEITRHKANADIKMNKYLLFGVSSIR